MFVFITRLSKFITSFILFLNSIAFPKNFYLKYYPTNRPKVQWQRYSFDVLINRYMNTELPLKEEESNRVRKKRIQRLSSCV